MPSREEVERENRERDHTVQLNQPVSPSPASRVYIASKDIKAEVIALIDAKLVEYEGYGAATEALKDLKARVSRL